MRRCRGGYAVVLLINRIGMVAFRDPNGIRPLCFGRRVPEGMPVEEVENGKGQGCDWAVASESVAIDALDPAFKLARDVGPGEAVFIDLKGRFHSQVVHPQAALSPCLFEYVYFARPDTVMDGVSVYEARGNMGEKLAKRVLQAQKDNSDGNGGQNGLDIDIVMPIPETSRTSALQCAKTLGVPYREGFVKNRYIARTFIMPGQEARVKTVRLKLNTIKSEFQGKVVLLVDDSIVRGTTSSELIKMAKEAGARKVYFASAAPPVIHSNVYGIDIPTRTELIAFDRNEDEIAKILRCDGVYYNSLEDVEDSVRSLNKDALFRPFESSCFNGVYVTGDDAVEAVSPRGGGGAFAAKVRENGNGNEENPEIESDSDSDGEEEGEREGSNSSSSSSGGGQGRHAGSGSCESLDTSGQGTPRGNYYGTTGGMKRKR